MRLHKNSIAMMLLLGTLSSFGPLSLDMYLPGLPAMTTSLHTSTALIQMSISTCITGLAVGQLFIGPISDRIGRKRPLMIGLALFATTSMALALISNIWLFLGVRFIQGLAGSAGSVLSRAIAKDLFTGRQLTSFYAKLMAINGLFPVIAPIMGAGVLIFGPWQLIFAVLMVIGILLLLATLLLPETAPALETKTTNHQSWSVLMTSKAFWQPTLVVAMASGVLFSYISGSSFIYQKVFHMSSQGFSILYAINGAGLAFGSALAGKLANTFSEQKILRGSLLITETVIGLMVLNALTEHSNIVAMLGIFLIIGNFGIVTTITTSMAMQVPGINAGISSAALGLSSNIVGGFSSPLVGVFGTATPLPMFLIILVFQSLAILGFFGLREKRLGDR